MPALVRPGRKPPAKAEKATTRTIREAELWGENPRTERKPRTPAVASVRSGPPTRFQLVRRIKSRMSLMESPIHAMTPINYSRDGEILPHVKRIDAENKKDLRRPGNLRRRPRPRHAPLAPRHPPRPDRRMEPRRRALPRPALRLQARRAALEGLREPLLEGDFARGPRRAPPSRTAGDDHAPLRLRGRRSLPPGAAQEGRRRTKEKKWRAVPSPTESNFSRPCFA